MSQGHNGLSKAVAFAPATVGNVGVGFDILGHALDAVGDTITVKRIEEPEIRIQGIDGCEGQIPMAPEINTATAGLIVLRHDKRFDFGFEVHVHKGIPLGSGMGGSAASAAGAIVAASALLEEALSPEEMLEYALLGEEVASGAAHADNLAPCLFGGMQLVRGGNKPKTLQVPVPSQVLCVLVNPKMRLDTKRSREVLKRGFELHDVVEQSGHLAHFLSACYTDDVSLLKESLRDVLVEPHRASLIPGFSQVQSAAYAQGALGCTISGGGPSVFAWCVGQECAERIREAMKSAFLEHGELESTGYISTVQAEGTRIMEVV